jgi:yecA family protein
MTTPAYVKIVALCKNTEINDNVKELHEILGFICAISCAPAPLELQEWLPQLWKKGVSPTFSQQQLAIDFATAVLQFHDDCLAHFQQATTLHLPTELWLDQSSQITDNGQYFAVGYLSGFHCIEDSWNNTEIEAGSDFEQVLQTTTLLLSKVANPDNNAPEMQSLFSQLPDFNEIVTSLPMLISTLGFFSLQVKEHE